MRKIIQKLQVRGKQKENISQQYTVGLNIVDGRPIVQSTLTSYNQYGVGVKGQRGKPELFTNGVLRVSIPSAIASLGFFECLHIYISFLFYIFV